MCLQDATITNAVEEYDDNGDPMTIENAAMVPLDANDQEETQEGLPNNDFCFTEADFLETRNQMNDATRHQGSYNEAWDIIRNLVGEEIQTTSTKYGNLKWKVVPSTSILDDEFEMTRKEESQSLKERIVPLKSAVDRNKFGDENDFNATFWSLWPTSVDEDVENLNEIISLDNVRRKENYQRPIRLVTKQEFITFHALLIGATAYSEVGEQLWASDITHSRKKRRHGISQRTDFGKYMKQWRFKQIRQYIPDVMADKSKAETDAWWKFSSRVNKFNAKRKELLKSSHVLVFDESMSAFVPR